MDRTRDVAVLVGSLRKDSINRKVANALLGHAATLKLSIIEIGHLPIYNQDGDEDPPAAWTQFRERIKVADAVLFVTPEHNRSVPAALKNAIDIGSRPYGKSTWTGKPGAVVSASPGSMAVSVPTTTCGNRWCFSMFPRWPSRRLISGEPTSCSTHRASWSTTGHANFCRLHAGVWLVDRGKRKIIATE